jgi:hypothetical protein
MAQKPQVIDLRKSYLPGDPNAFPNNLISTEREDGEEQTIEVVPFEGYNFLPTEYGYRSYFGQNSELALNALTARTQFIILYRGLNNREYYIALCEDGIHIARADIATTWTHAVIHTFDSNVFEEWTYCLMENTLYAYKQGTAQVYYTSITGDALFLIPGTPTFLNMAGQMGIFRAGTKLGFWDSANSVSWSSTFDKLDFIPSLETSAGNSIFAECVGRIVTIRANGDAFIIYCTGTIVGAVIAKNPDMVWDAKKILDNGIFHPRAVTTANMLAEHYAWTTAGILQISQFNPFSGTYKTEFMMPDFYDYLRESRLPIYLDCIQDRYLTFRVFEGKYIYQRASHTAQIVDPTRTAVVLADEYWDGDFMAMLPIIDGNTLLTILQQWEEDNAPETITTYVEENDCEEYSTIDGARRSSATTASQYSTTTSYTRTSPYIKPQRSQVRPSKKMTIVNSGD